jgi:lysozyme|tara:strand:- start:4726 stop:5487 length:762 start_codon:yes stop_codon:yes gene_type:complete
MKKQTYLLGVVLFISFFLSCKHHEKKVDQSYIRPVIKENLIPFVYGIDISHHQNNEIDFISKTLDSLSFVICKATEGVTYTDPLFLKNWKTIKARGFIRGAYHFYHSNDDPIAQATHFMNTITNLENTDIPPIIDFEGGGIDTSQSVEEIQSALKIFLNEVQKKSKRTPIIYTDLNTGNKYLNSSYFSDYPLWIANYNGKKSPDLPDAWKKRGWFIWQRTSTYKLDSQNNDFDIFDGSLSAFKEFISNSLYKK